MKQLLTFAFLLFQFVLFGQNETSQPWDIDDLRSPSFSFEYSAEEGTWMSLDISPDGESIVFDLLGHIYIISAEGGEAQPLTKGRSWNTFPRYSPDGSQLLFTSDRSGSEDIWTLNLANSTLTNVSKMKLPVFQGTWSRDGRHVYGTALNMKVRFPAYQFNFYGTKQELIPAGGREPANLFTYHPSSDILYFEHNLTGNLYSGGGPRIKSYDLETGEIETIIQRPGGAANPSISPDGKWMAFVGKDDRETVLFLHNLETGREKIIIRGLDNGRFESRSFYGCYTNMDWHPDGNEIFLSFNGEIRAVNIESGQSRKIPFTAPVIRQIDRTHRVRLDLQTEGNLSTQSHRWGNRSPRGIIYEALGDIYLKTPEGLDRLTATPDHETNPSYDWQSNMLYFSRWNDDELGTLAALDLETMKEQTISSTPSQYGPVASTADGTKLAYIRGGGGLIDGQRLEDQTDFELVVKNDDDEEMKLTDIEWIGNRYAKRPPTVLWDKSGNKILFTEYVDGSLVIKRIDRWGTNEQTLYRLPNATRAIVSPDFKWIAFREYHRTFITPFEFSGKELSVSASDGMGHCIRVDKVDGDFTEWKRDGTGLVWTRGKFFIEKSLEDIVSGQPHVQKTDLSVTFPIHAPNSTLALTNVQILTMNEGDDIISNGTILIKNNQIIAVGQEITIPGESKIYDLSGHTVMPGMFDAHGHYGSPISALNVIEQRLYGLHANLAYGVTTMYDVYGTTQKDFWVNDMLRAGKIIGPRIFSVGDPVFVTKYRTKMHRPITSLNDAVEIADFNKDHGATALKDYSNHTRKARQHLIDASRSRQLNLVTESFSNPQMNLTQIVDGFTGIEHTLGLTPLYDDVIQMIASTEIGITPTLIVVYNGVSGENYFYQRERIWEDPKLLNFYSKDQLIRHRRPSHYFEDDFYHKEMAAEMLKLHNQGVLLQMGAHGQKMGIGAHWEMEMFVHGGFSPYDALKISTINGFKHHGLDHVLGSIEAGKLADLIILKEDPLADIRNSRSIRYVMKNGVLYNGIDVSSEYPVVKPQGKMYFK